MHLQLHLCPHINPRSQPPHVIESPTNTMRRPDCCPAVGDGGRKRPAGESVILRSQALPCRASVILMIWRVCWPVERQGREGRAWCSDVLSQCGITKQGTRACEASLICRNVLLSIALGTARNVAALRCQPLHSLLGAGLLAWGEPRLAPCQHRPARLNVLHRHSLPI